MSEKEEIKKLRKCYCGYGVATFYQLRGMERLWFVSCSNPKCDIRTPYHHTEEKAVESWNARPEIQPDPLLAECVEMLKSILESYEEDMSFCYIDCEKIDSLLARCEGKAGEA